MRPRDDVDSRAADDDVAAALDGDLREVGRLDHDAVRLPDRAVRRGKAEGQFAVVIGRTRSLGDVAEAFDAAVLLLLVLEKPTELVEARTIELEGAFEDLVRDRRADDGGAEEILGDDRTLNLLAGEVGGA